MITGTAAAGICGAIALYEALKPFLDLSQLLQQQQALNQEISDLQNSQKQCGGDEQQSEIYEQEILDYQQELAQINQQIEANKSGSVTGTAVDILCGAIVGASFVLPTP